MICIVFIHTKLRLNRHLCFVLSPTMVPEKTPQRICVYCPLIELPINPPS